MENIFSLLHQTIFSATKLNNRPFKVGNALLLYHIFVNPHVTGLTVGFKHYILFRFFHPQMHLPIDRFFRFLALVSILKPFCQIFHCCFVCFFTLGQLRNRFGGTCFKHLMPQLLKKNRTTVYILTCFVLFIFLLFILKVTILS